MFVKWEQANPTGSMKDQMAVEVIRSAAADGKLERGGTVVEYTAGTTGVSLALVCAALGYRPHVVFSDAFSVEKCKTMLALGAQIADEPSGGGRITKGLIKRDRNVYGDQQLSSRKIARFRQALPDMGPLNSLDVQIRPLGAPLCTSHGGLPRTTAARHMSGCSSGSTCRVRRDADSLGFEGRERIAAI
jgi:hypothetical protein